MCVQDHINYEKRRGRGRKVESAEVDAGRGEAVGGNHLAEPQMVCHMRRGRYSHMQAGAL